MGQNITTVNHAQAAPAVVRAAGPEIRESGDPLPRAIRQARAEFMEMPGLKLTCAQAARLWALDQDQCRAVLTALVGSGFLIVTRDAAFVRQT